MRGHIRSYELKRGQKQWAIVLFLGKDTTGKRKYRWIRGFETKREADTEMRRVLRSMDEGTYVEPSKETVGAYLDRWLATYAKPNVAGKTYERYEQISKRTSSPPSARSCSPSSLRYASPNSTVTRSRAAENEERAGYPPELCCTFTASCEKLFSRP